MRPLSLCFVPSMAVNASPCFARRTTIRRLRCERCDNLGLSYVPYQNPQGKYRVLATCCRCGNVQEF